MTSLKIKYSDLIQLGFERHSCHDNIFFNEFGYHFFSLEYKITEFMFLEYSAEDEYVSLHVLNAENTIIWKSEIKDYESIKQICKK